MPGPGGGLLQGGAWSWGGVSGLGGACSRGGACPWGPGGDPLWMATAAGGTHPTGMHSCWSVNEALSNDISKALGLVDTERTVLIVK